MPRKRTMPPASKTTYLLLNREGEPVVITPKEPLAQAWSEEGYGDYREIEVLYSKDAIAARGGVDDRRVG